MKEYQLMANLKMRMEFSKLKMGLNIRGVLGMGNCMALEGLSGLMEEFTKANSKMDYLMVMASISGLMGSDSKVSMLMACVMGEGGYICQMEEYTMELGTQANYKEQACFPKMKKFQ